MPLKIKNLVLLTLCFVSLSSSIFAASLEKAILLNEHGLTSDAKRELIDVIFQKGSKVDDKAQAYYLLGNIAFGEDRIKTALNAWEHLVDKYPNSDEAGLVKDRITELSEIVVESAKESLDNAVARSYLRHAEFWSKGKSNVFSIDSSWISNIDAAIKWYDKIIAEFPKSTASRVTYEEKLKTLIGWKEPGRYGVSYGLANINDTEAEGSLRKVDAEGRFTIYMPILLKSFEEFEKDHPDASTLQAFRYQIAQIYWRRAESDPTSHKRVRKYPEETKNWLNKIIDKAKGHDSFYRDLAERRLKSLNPR